MAAQPTEAEHQITVCLATIPLDLSPVADNESFYRDLHVTFASLTWIRSCE